MQLVLSNNRVIAHGENFLSMGGVVVNTETGEKYENATVAECECVPSDIDKVGYEYHGGIFVPCAPYGTGDNNGYFMEVCSKCATPRSTGIPIKGGLGLENFQQPIVDALKWDSLSEVALNISQPEGSGGSSREFDILFPVNADDIAGYVDYRVILKDAAGISPSTDEEVTFESYCTLDLPKGEQQTFDDAVILRGCKSSYNQSIDTNYKVKVSPFNGGTIFTATLELQGRKE